MNIGNIPIYNLLSPDGHLPRRVESVSVKSCFSPRLDAGDTEISDTLGSAKEEMLVRYLLCFISTKIRYVKLCGMVS